MAPSPPPPPPPPPPPAPPPPPPPGNGGLSRKGLNRRSKMRNFNWEAIPQHTVLGKHNIWTTEQTHTDYELDTKGMEELFSRTDQSPAQRKPSTRRSVHGMPASTQGPEVSILSSKRNMNIGIFLKQFKRPMADMVADISQGLREGFGRGKLQELCKLLPEEEEVRQLHAYQGDISVLSEADLFMVLLVKVPCYEERLQSLVLKEEFSPFMDELNQSIATMTAAGQELLECVDLHSVIRLVLKTGNYMNAGGYAGSAIGFRMTSLLKLADTKANKPGMNLMHYVVMQAQKIDMNLLKFPNQLEHLADAARIQKQELEAEFQRKVKKVQEVKENAEKQPELKEQVEDFLKDAESSLAETESSFQDLNSVTQSVAEYFCEDPTQFKLEECCHIFHCFCEKFKRAIQENRDREVAEVKRRQRERVQCAAKRRSTASCSTRDKDMEGVALENILQRFLNSRTSRRRGGSRSPSGSSCGSLSEIPSRESCLTERNSGTGEGGGGGGGGGGGDCRGEAGGRDGTKGLEVQRHGRNSMSGSRQSLDKENVAENVPVDDPLANEGSVRTEDVICSTPVSKRNMSVTSNSSQITVSMTEDSREHDGDDEEESLAEEEAQKMREVSRKVLRYQTSRSSISSAADVSLDAQRSPGVLSVGSGSAASPRQRTFLEEEEKTPEKQPGGGDQEAAVVLRPHQRFLQSKSNGIVRRHTLTVPPVSKEEDSDEDDIWIPAADPKRPRAPHLSQVGKIKSEHLMDAANSSFEFVDTPVKNPPGSSVDGNAKGDEEEKKRPPVPPLNFNLMQGSLVQRRSATRSPSGFMSFFKRLGEKSKPL